MVMASAAAGVVRTSGYGDFHRGPWRGSRRKGVIDGAYYSMDAFDGSDRGRQTLGPGRLKEITEP